MEHYTTIREITPLSDKDCLYIVERKKNEFTYPLHTHGAYELNFIRNGKGLRRIVGDHISEIDDLELVLIAGADLEHTWEQGNCPVHDMYEITIQFTPDLFPVALLNKNQYATIRTMLERAQCGVSFSQNVIISVYGLLEDMLRSRDSFQQLLLFLSLMNRLSLDDAAVSLSTSSFSRSAFNSDSRRVQKVDDYLRAHYIEEITLGEMASLVGMTPVSFSRFFKLRTGTTFSNYLIKMRLGYATRMLVDTTHSIAEIAYQTGFNNLSNFNRLFKKHKHMSPNEFRATYLKNKMLL